MVRDVKRSPPATKAEWDATHKEIGIDGRSKRVLQQVIKGYNEKIPKVERAIVEAENAPDIVAIDDLDDPKGWTAVDMVAGNAKRVTLLKAKLARLNNKLEICKNKVG